MILYNVTIQIEHDVHHEWLAWMREEHIPEVMATGCFKEYRISRLMGVDEQDGFTYSIQYLMPHIGAYQDYQKEHALALQAKHNERYKEKFVAFRTLMKVVDQS